MVVEMRTELRNQALEKGKLLDFYTHQRILLRKCSTKKSPNIRITNSSKITYVYSRIPARPLSVKRYFWNRLRGFSGSV